MSGFSFPPPPPPPPPPKPAQPQQYLQQHRGRGQGRVGTRGGHNQRGRNDSGGHDGQGSIGFQRAHSGNYRGARNGSNHTTSSASPNNLQPGSSSSNFPPGAFVNPRFTGNQYGATGEQYPSSPPNVQATLPPTRGYRAQQTTPADSLPRTVAGHKRKLEALREPSKEKKPAPPTAPAIPSFGISNPTASSTTPPGTIRPNETKSSKTRLSGKSLGLVPVAEDHADVSSDSDKDGPEVDEEAAYGELGNKLTFEHNGVLMSLNSVADLNAWKKDRQKNYPTEQRKAERYLERQKIGDERKRLLAGAYALQNTSQRGRPTSDRRPRNGLAVKVENASHDEPTSTLHLNESRKSETELEKTKREFNERTKQLDELRRKVAQSEERNRQARAQQAVHVDKVSELETNTHSLVQREIDGKSVVTGISNFPHLRKGEDDDTTLEAVHPTLVQEEPHGRGSANAGIPSSITGDTHLEAELDEDADEALEHSGSSPVASSSNISSDSSPTSDDDSDDEPPEELDSKAALSAASNPSVPVCRYFAASGRCRDGDACRYKHDSPSNQSSFNLQHHQATQRQQPQQVKRDVGSRFSDNAATPKKGIFERLKEQEQEEEDRLALKVIKYLGEAGFFKESQIGEKIA